MDADCESRIRSYLSATGSRLGEELGSGVEGVVFQVERNAISGVFAVKFHYRRAAFEKESRVYQRLREHSVRRVEGCNVPQFLGADRRFLAIEMTIVTRPFVVDFSGADLDGSPPFSDEIWRQWRRDKREQFGADWPEVEAILRELRWIGVHLHDISPANISFRD